MGYKSEGRPKSPDSNRKSSFTRDFRLGWSADANTNNEETPMKRKGLFLLIGLALGGVGAVHAQDNTAADTATSTSTTTYDGRWYIAPTVGGYYNDTDRNTNSRQVYYGLGVGKFISSNASLALFLSPTKRDRDKIIRHTVRTESEDFAKRLGLRIPEGGALTPTGLRDYRKTYVAAMRAYNAGEGKRMRSWNLPFLIRHSAYHVMDHAWEMEDKDLSAPTA